ncbi:MAG: hypothetical protein J6C96_02530 [Oscillospiraceae bacterium]|nr:hypothetical protein [Oscillospiraceae bacterium]
MELGYIGIRTSNGVLYGGNQAHFGKAAARSGCGMIAACDMILYTRKKRSLSFSEYSGFVCAFRDNKAYKHTSNPIGIFPHRLTALINSEAQDASFRFYSRRAFTPDSLRRFIFASVERGMPVIVRVGLNGKSLPFKIISGSNCKESCMGWHYITVTGIVGDRLTFSSWGEKGVMKCSRLYRHFGLTGGVIADSKIPAPN